MNNTVADISVLEGIQTNANASMDMPMSPMMLFNAEYKEKRPLTPDEKKKADALKAKINKAEQIRGQRILADKGQKPGETYEAHKAFNKEVKPAIAELKKLGVKSIFQVWVETD
jgi:regulator of PEP synthase PpsR (kinase-PPPase family)